MTRNYLVLFLFLLVLCTAVIFGLAGPKGLLTNRSLEQYVEQKRYVLDVQRLQLETLQHRYDNVHSRESVLDAARKMGYVQRGERVYLFFDSQGAPVYPNGETQQQPISTPSDPGSTFHSERGISFSLSLLLALLLSMSITGSIALIRYKRKRSREEPVILSFNGEVYGNHHRKT